MPYRCVTEDGFRLWSSGEEAAWQDPGRESVQSRRSRCDLPVVESALGSLTWYRTLHRFRATTSTGPLLPPALRQWADRQRSDWPRLRPHQQRLLTTVGIACVGSG